MENWKQTILIFLIFFIKNGQTQNAECGISAIEASFNSSISDSHSWPWQVSIRANNLDDEYNHICAGTLIDLDYVLTSASCVKKHSNEDLMVVVGLNNLNDDLEPELNVFQVNEIISHPEFDQKNLLNNVAVLKLSRKVELSDNVRLICLSNKLKNNLIFGKIAVSVGWSYYRNRRSNELLQNTLKVENNQDEASELCNGRDENNYCLVNEDFRNCVNDIGSPLLYNLNNRWFLIGLANFDLSKTPTCFDKSTLFYSFISDHLDFIHSITNIDLDKQFSNPVSTDNVQQRLKRRLQKRIQEVDQQPIFLEQIDEQQPLPNKRKKILKQEEEEQGPQLQQQLQEENQQMQPNDRQPVKQEQPIEF